MKSFLIVFALVLALPTALAFEVNAPSQTFNVPALTSMQIDLTVTSTVNETVTVDMIESNQWVTLGASQLQVAPGSPAKLSVFISPLENTPTILYRVSVLFESVQTKELKKGDIFVLVQKGEVINIERIMVTGSLQPTGFAKVSVVVKNHKTITAQGVEVQANVTSPRGIIGTVNGVVPRLDPGEEGFVEATIPLGDYAGAGSYEVRAAARFQDESISGRQTFFVEPAAVIRTDEQKDPLLFGFSKRIMIKNYGNVAGDEAFSDIVSRFDSAFFSGDKPFLVSGDEYIWLEKGIAPGEERIIRYRVDYTPFFVFVLAVVVAAWVYFTKYRTIRVKKYIMQKKHIVEGEEFTVAVEIANGIGKAADVEVQDFVPAVFGVKDAEGPKPQKKKSQIGAEMTWHAKSLKPRESRVFSYKIVPAFGVHGMINLPKASASFAVGKRRFESRSSHASIGVSEVPAEEQLWKKFFRVKK